MKKTEKGFTLIELLVVVAIIGILAAVGVVAYSGYTAGAKKSASKSNQGAVVKYIAAEMKKCSMGDEGIMKNAAGTATITCKTMNATGGDAALITAANTVLKDEFKNPYDTKNTAIVTGATATAPTCDKDNRGKTNIGSVSGTIYVHTCFDAADGTTTNVLTNSMLVE